MTRRDYQHVAKALGKAKEYLRTTDISLTAFNIVVDCICLELQSADRLFDEQKFRLAIRAFAAEE